MDEAPRGSGRGGLPRDDWPPSGARGDTPGRGQVFHVRLLELVPALPGPGEDVPGIGGVRVVPGAVDHLVDQGRFVLAELVAVDEDVTLPLRRMPARCEGELARIRLKYAQDH